MSDFLKSNSDDVASSGQIARPMLSVSEAVNASFTNSFCTTRLTRSHTTAAFTAAFNPGNSRISSSPPQRATVSVLEACFRRRKWTVVGFAGRKAAGSFADTPLAIANELDQVPQFRRRRQFRFDLCHRVGNRQTLATQNFVGLLQSALHLLRHPVTVQADLVDRARLGGVPVGQHEGRHILHDFRTRSEDRHFPDAAKLVYRGQP